MLRKIKDLVPGMTVQSSRGPVNIVKLRKKVNTPRGLVYHWYVSGGYTKTLSGLGDMHITVFAVPAKWAKEQETKNVGKV